MESIELGEAVDLGPVWDDDGESKREASKRFCSTYGAGVWDELSRQAQIFDSLRRLARNEVDVQQGRLVRDLRPAHKLGAEVHERQGRQQP